MSETFNRITGKLTAKPVKPVAGQASPQTGQVQANNTPTPTAVPAIGQNAPQPATGMPSAAKPNLADGVKGVDAKQQGIAVTQQPSEGGTSSPENGGRKFVPLADIVEMTSPYRPPTPEELEKERKRQKRQSMWAAIGDGVSALANLYFTTKGAPNSYNPQTSMSAKLKEQFDKIDAERKANTARYQEAYMRAKQYDNMNEQNEREYRRKVFSDMRQAKKDATMLEMKARELEMKGELNEAQKLRQEAETRRADAMAGKYKTDADWAGRLNYAKVENLKTGAAAHRASATNSYAQANKANRSDGGKKGGSTKPYGTLNGKDYATKADYDKAVLLQANKLGIPTTVTTGELKTPKGFVYDAGKTTAKPISKLAAEVEARSQPATPKGNVAKPVIRKPADKKYQHTRSLGL